MPKFDVSSDLSLIEGLQALGVTDVFNPLGSDFSPMTTDTDEIFLSQVQHAVRVVIDEKGCTGSAYIVMATNESAPMPPDEKVDFTLDRPFLFAVTGQNGLPVFIGVVNQPG